MRAVIVKGTSPLIDKRCRGCPRNVRAGQSVIVANLPRTGYREDKFVVHTECMAALVDAAPVGIPVTSKRAAVGRFARLRRHVAAGGDPFELELSA